ncbi:MAG: GTPase ObgE [Tissierellia bacterium]|nr:GTPase ObgE [Tissierellia bacterium]
MFVDIAKINLKAGKGGDGAVAFRREKYEPAGGPYGGDGGAGGSIILRGDEGIRTLMDFRYKRHYKAEGGENGKTKRQFGKDGEDLVLRLPVGTLVKDAKTDKVIVDMREHNQEFVIAKGGKGGRGNAKFATATRQAPRFAEPGGIGEEIDVVFELKLLADVGLVGFPNVGKSTILSMVSEARPKIANYHFTTLKPNLGVVKIEEEKSFVIADIPGLIEGAHEGVGLGHDFLRHVERTRVLVHVLDASGMEGRDPIEDFYKINEELLKYNPKLSEKPQIVVANKMDIPSSNEWLEKIKEEFEKQGYEVYPVSAATGEGIKKLKYSIWEVLSTIESEYETFDEHLDITAEKNMMEDFTVKKENGKYIIEGPYIETLVYGTNFDDYDSLRYFQNALREKGIVDKLKELDIEEEDTVYILDYEFEYFE